MNEWARLYGEVLKHGLKIRIKDIFEDGSMFVETYGIGTCSKYVLEPNKPASRGWRNLLKVLKRNSK